MSATHQWRRLVWAAGAPGVTAISHHSAAHLHGLLPDPPALIHVIAVRGDHPRSAYGVIVHHTRSLDGRECGELPWLPAVPVTRPETSVVMLGGYLSDLELVDIVRRALDDGHCTATALRDAAVRRLTRGRRGPRRVLDALDRVLGPASGDLAVTRWRAPARASRRRRPTDRSTAPPPGR